MPAYYVETSALLKRYKSEPGSYVVRELFESKRADDLLVTSHLSLLEVTAVAARLLRGRVFSRRRYERTLATLGRDITTYDVRVVPLHDHYVQEALQLYPAYPLRAPDALHFAVALSVRDAVGEHSFWLVSGDRDIAEAARAHPVRLIDPEAPEALSQLRSLR